MTEQKKNKRTRRRFLADMLFLGGGVTAAAILAKSQLGRQPVEPPVMGAMEVPIELQATPCPTPDQTPDRPPISGEPMPIDIEPDIGGEVALPQEPPQVKGDVATPPPKTGGKPIAPRHNSENP